MCLCRQHNKYLVMPLSLEAVVNTEHCMVLCSERALCIHMIQIPCSVHTCYIAVIKASCMRKTTTRAQAWKACAWCFGGDIMQIAHGLIAGGLMMYAHAGKTYRHGMDHEFIKSELGIDSILLHTLNKHASIA